MDTLAIDPLYVFGVLNIVILGVIVGIRFILRKRKIHFNKIMHAELQEKMMSEKHEEKDDPCFVVAERMIEVNLLFSQMKEKFGDSKQMRPYLDELKQNMDFLLEDSDEKNYFDILAVLRVSEISLEVLPTRKFVVDLVHSLDELTKRLDSLHLMRRYYISQRDRVSGLHDLLNVGKKDEVYAELSRIYSEIRTLMEA
ncbi:MAG TPA: hypothetical protein VFM02_03230 [Candidatus Paceibacterota bacterium]|nr:hypothetical protein [Candidatus Paceibacterota bacterium]